MSKNETFYNEIPILDHGFVRLVDFMGDDSAIVQAARVSYGKGTKTLNKDRGLIRYMMSNGHTSPFEMVEIKLHCKMPIFCARQWVRHRTASLNEYSGRYSEMKNEFYVPESNRIQAQSTTNKQGSEINEVIDNSEFVKTIFKNGQISARSDYEKVLEQGTAKEIARINLPLSQYTEWYWKIDLHNLFNFLRLRMDSHAQWEMQQYANAIASIVKKIVPFAWEAFEDYVLYSKRFSRIEYNILCDIIKEYDIEDSFGSKASRFVDLERMTDREADEFMLKIKNRNSLIND